MRLLQSKLVKDFCCIASDCPSVCCKEWNIIWHKSEVEKLFKCGISEITDKIPCAFDENGDYFTVKHRADTFCPYYTEKGLCSIHENAGEDYLSYVCREYPRISRACGDIALRSCRTSCYAVMDIISKYPDCMDIVETDNFDIAMMISTENNGKRLLHIYNMKKEFPIYNNVDTSRIFTEIFGWEIITAKTDEDKQHAKTALSEYCCKEFEENLIKAVFMEWIISDFCFEASDEDNLRCFDFCANIIKSAVIGAAYAADNKQQFICTVSDIISFLLSNTRKIIMHLQQKQ